MEKGLFINIRDHLLLTNPVGEKIVHFYYRYTLYPAGALKPLDHKLLKTSNLGAITENPYKNKLRETLLKHDWLETETIDDVDLTLSISNNKLLLHHKHGSVMAIPKNEFLLKPAEILNRFSYQADNHQFFRRFTFYSLLFGFPIILYIFGYSLFSFMMGPWIPPGKTAVLSTSLCFLMGITLLIPFWRSNSHPMNQEGPGQMLESKNRFDRLTALKRIRENRLEIFGFSTYESILQSPHAAERYWLTKALGVSKRKRAHKDLLKLLEDPSPFVAAAALRALGQRGEKKTLSRILDCIKTSEDAYLQWYAYKTLKSLGWRQKSREN